MPNSENNSQDFHSKSTVEPPSFQGDLIESLIQSADSKTSPLEKPDNSPATSKRQEADRLRRLWEENLRQIDAKRAEISGCARYLVEALEEARQPSLDGTKKRLKELEDLIRLGDRLWVEYQAANNAALNEIKAGL